ncbi:ABC transporter ATP-binding protein [Tessaracoccus palaemonis]|uniref:ABC transporter ATP-binding protein/permease n=1 Tax=Tessaracoccus palaemonis TaxID=2829499 RepID=A0ABX8SE92_9ACTN|nr:ABC transporter ATP-binding protein [Tessaracoccus palaemonis]QXT61610.1 ABC transporter ATP-binding protein/permease [Tessaracoccus palaemonis]
MTMDMDTAQDAAGLPIAGGRECWGHLRSLLKVQWRALAATTVLLLLGSVAGVLTPILLGRIVDAVVARSELRDVAILAGLVTGAGIVSALLLLAGGRLLVACLQRALAELREEVFAAALGLDQGVVEDAGTSDVVSRVTGDVEAITQSVSGVLPRFTQAAFVIVLTLVGLTAIDPWLALAALAAVPVQLYATVRFLRRSRPLYRRLRREESTRGQAIIESVRGADTVIAGRAHGPRLELISRRSLSAVETGRQTTSARNRFNGGLNLGEFLGLAAVLAVGFWRTGDAGLTVGAVTAAALFFHRLFAPIGALLSSIDDLQRAAAGLGRLVGVLLAHPGTPVRQEIADGGISLRSVSYRYRPNAADVLGGIALDIPAGCTTVLVGASGSGKSTLAQLIAGVLTPRSGEVLVGGVPAAEAWHGRRRAVLLVTQDTHLFAGTLADNLRLAAPAATDSALWSALDEVGAGWARELPGGLDTVLGHDLDDGRIQGLALARVLLADPAVVVLDEATAHSGAEGELDAAVQAVARGRTAVIVAHRFAQAEAADLVVVLERGRIIERGTHAELVRQPGNAYARLHAAANRGAPHVDRCLFEAQSPA